MLADEKTTVLNFSATIAEAIASFRPPYSSTAVLLSRLAHRPNWACVANQLQFFAAARALKIAKLIARRYWLGDAAQHFDAALRTGWPVVDVRAHRHHRMGG